jgi:hypothetical protein
MPMRKVACAEHLPIARLIPGRIVIAVRSGKLDSLGQAYVTHRHTRNEKGQGTFLKGPPQPLGEIIVRR